MDPMGVLDKLLVRGDHTKKSFAFAHCCFDHPSLGGQRPKNPLRTVILIKPHPNFPILTWSLKNEVPDNFLKGYGTFVIYIYIYMVSICFHIKYVIRSTSRVSFRKLHLGDSKEAVAGISVAARPRSGPMRNWALWNYTIRAAASVFLGDCHVWGWFSMGMDEVTCDMTYEHMMKYVSNPPSRCYPLVI